MSTITTTATDNGGNTVTTTATTQPVHTPAESSMLSRLQALEDKEAITSHLNKFLHFVSKDKRRGSL